MCVCVRALSRLSCVWLCAPPWTVAHQAPLFMIFSRQEHWSGLPCPPSGDLPDPGIETMSPVAPALLVNSLLLSHQESPIQQGLFYTGNISNVQCSPGRWSVREIQGCHHIESTAKQKFLKWESVCQAEKRGKSMSGRRNMWKIILWERMTRLRELRGLIRIISLIRNDAEPRSLVICSQIKYFLLLISPN